MSSAAGSKVSVGCEIVSVGEKITGVADAKGVPARFSLSQAENPNTAIISAANRMEFLINIRMERFYNKKGFAVWQTPLSSRDDRSRCISW